MHSEHVYFIRHTLERAHLNRLETKREWPFAFMGAIRQFRFATAPSLSMSCDSTENQRCGYTIFQRLHHADITFACSPIVRNFSSLIFLLKICFAVITSTLNDHTVTLTMDSTYFWLFQRRITLLNGTDKVWWKINRSLFNPTLKIPVQSNVALKAKPKLFR